MNFHAKPLSNQRGNLSQDANARPRTDAYQRNGGFNSQLSMRRRAQNSNSLMHPQSQNEGSRINVQRQNVQGNYDYQNMTNQKISEADFNIDSRSQQHEDDINIESANIQLQNYYQENIKDMNAKDQSIDDYVDVIEQDDNDKYNTII